MPGELGAAEIYAIARDAGFSPDQAVTMTAIALAESGGEPRAHDGGGEDSRGLWPIDDAALGDQPWAEGLDLDDPQHNAIAAWHLSHEGSDLSPWTVTHGGGSRYVEFADEARHAALVHGEPAGGDFAVAPAAFPPPSTPSVDPGLLGDGPGDVLGDGSVQRFLDAAIAQQGIPHVVNAHTDPAEEFDSSELVQWAALQSNVQVAESPNLQYLDMRAAGTTIPVEDAVNTPGALLFRFSAEPQPGRGPDDGAHVAISLGDGRTIEAQSSTWGVEFGEAGVRFGYAALIPGLDYSNPPTVDDGGDVLAPPAFVSPPLLPPLTAADTDDDVLPDHFELTYPLDPHQPDTAGDGITDGYELVVLGSTPDGVDTELDQLTDQFGTALGPAPPLADDLDQPLELPDDLPVETHDGGVIDWDDDLAGTGSFDPEYEAHLDADDPGDTEPFVADG